MILTTEKRILIVGLGLIGGSYAKALTKLGYHVSAIDKKSESVAYAITAGFIENGATEVEEDFVKDADLVIFALYPHTFIEWIEKYQSCFKSGALITDVTGVKGAIIRKIQDMLRDDVEFIAAHPMAGRESSGVQNSDETVFHGANYVVTPTEKNTDAAVAICCDLGRQLGFANISTLSPEEHDEMIAFLSQLTHCIAICLMTCKQEDRLQDYTGDSFRDLTRIARLNDEMWSELFLLNKEPLIREMDLFTDELKKLREMIVNNDREGMREMMRHSTLRRALFDKKA